MSLPNVKDKWIRNNPWCKELRKAFNYEKLADLIQKRIETPNATGPFLHTGDDSTEIITAFIQKEEDFRERAEPAIGLLLWKIKNGKMPENNALLRGLFTIIRESKLVNCQQLLYNWLQENVSWLTLGEGSAVISKKYTYREAMIAFAFIQKKDETIEHYWYNVWKEGLQFWWASAFLGLRIQNPKIASAELPLLISRKVEKFPYLLEGMWKDDNSKHQLECAIKKGLKDNTGWAGLALNSLLERLSEDNKNELMGHLK